MIQSKFFKKHLKSGLKKVNSGPVATVKHNKTVYFIVNKVMV